VVGVQSVERAFAILQSLSGGPAGVSELADRVALPKSTVSRLLSTLYELGAVEQANSGGEYCVGDLVIEIAGGAARGRGLITLARPFLVELAERTGEAAGLSVLDGRDMLYIDQVDVDRPVQVRDWTGVRIPAHAVSSGLIALAALSDVAREEYLAGPLDDVGARTTTNPTVLRRRIKAVARRGTEWAIEEYLEGINSVAAPVFGPDGRLIAVVHVHGPSYRFPPPQQADDVAAIVADGASRIAARLGGRPALDAV
jgi:DNA-binding IclR family transcriptional regulator